MVNMALYEIAIDLKKKYRKGDRRIVFRVAEILKDDDPVAFFKTATNQVIVTASPWFFQLKGWQRREKRLARDLRSFFQLALLRSEMFGVQWRTFAE